MKKKIILYLSIILITVIYIFVASPNLNPLYSDGAFFWCVLVTIFIVISQTQNFIENILGGFSKMLGDPKYKEIAIDRTKKFSKWSVIVLICMWGGYVAISVGSSVLFNANAYKSQMPEPEVKEFTSDIQAVDINQIPIVDAKLAYKLADKKLGEKPSLGSQVKLGEPTIQKVNEKLVWVVPLHHSGFFKWLSNLDGVPGYIVVSATNPQDITYVENYNIKYHPNSYFFDDLLRKVRLNSALFTGITDYSFELDDTGKPYWVVTTYKNLRGFNLPESTGIILLDAQTGEISRHNLENIPDWVDRVQPEQFIIEQINNKGKYIHGIFNFSNKDKFQTSRGSIIVYNNNSCYLFTGITSVGIDSSATGFYMVDMVTKQPILYRISGATEYSAMSSAEGKVQDLGYKAASPIILNISNNPTYFMTLKDNEGLIKKYAYVSVKDYGIVGVGDTVTQAKESFETALSDAGLIEDIPILEDSKKTVEGKIVRIGFTIKNNQTFYNILIDSMPNKIISIPFESNDKVSVSKEGDKVSIVYIEEEDSIRVLSFENSTINIKN